MKAIESRIQAIERCTRGDLKQQLDEMVIDDEPIGSYEEHEVFDLEAYKTREERKRIRKALRGIRRQLRLQDRQAVIEYQPVLEEQQRQIEEQDRKLISQLLTIERDWRRERAGIPDIHTRRRFLRDFIEHLEEQLANGAGIAVRNMLIKHRLELCELETLLIAA
ncbi:MAG TPA: hypothetical protein VIK37_01425 [Candidatus Saccharimonadales bacterium]